MRFYKTLTAINSTPACCVKVLLCLIVLIGYPRAHAAPTLDGADAWTAIMSGSAADPSDDSHSDDGDIVGDASHGSLYAKFDDNGTSEASDDTLLFRMRIGSPKRSAAFSEVGMIGMDANLDGRVDLFIAVDGSKKTRAVLLMDPGTDANNSPRTTSPSSLPSKWLENEGIYPFSEKNFLVAPVTKANDPHWNGDSDLGNDKGEDLFVTWSIPMADIASILAQPSPEDKKGNFGPRGAKGIPEFSQESLVQYVNFTQQNVGSNYSDLNGVDEDYEDKDTFEALRVFTAPVTPANPGGSESLTITKPVDADGFINSTEDDAVKVSGTAKAKSWVKLTAKDTDAATKEIVVWVQTDGDGAWAAAPLDLSGQAEGTLTFTAELVTEANSSRLAPGLAKDSTTAEHDRGLAMLTPSVASLTTGNTTPVITGTWGDRNGGSDSLTVTVNGASYAEGDALVIKGTAWTLSIPDSQPLTPGVYDVTATVRSLVGNFLNDGTSGELTISAPVPPSGLTPQHISFSAPAKVSQFETLTLTAVASSGLPVIFSVTSGPASITGNVLSFSGTGPVVVTARQAGDSTYLPAPNESATVESIEFHLPTSVANGWTTSYGGEDDLLVRRNTDAKSLAMQVVGNYAVAVAATGSTTNAAGNLDIYTAKYDAATGEKLWDVIHAGEAAGADEGAAISMDASGNVWIVGSVTNAAKNTDIYVAKYASANGALVWETTFKGVTGSVDYGNDGPGGFAAAAPYLGGDNRRNSLAVGSDGAAVVTGYITNSAKKMDAITLKFAADGSLVWSQTFNGPSSGVDYGHAVTIDSVGNIFVAGCSINLTPDAILLKYSGADGTPLWTKRYDGGKPDSAIALKLDSAGHPVISGYSQRATFDFLIARYDSTDGSLLWMDLRDGPASSSDSAWDLALVNGTQPIVTGTSYPRNGSSDGYTFRFNDPAAPDSIAWAKHYNGPADRLDQFLSIGTDMFSNPVVTGFSQNANGTYDTLTVKYAVADGSVLWQKRYNGPADGNDLPRHVVVDPAGNVFVAGFSTSEGGTTDSWVTRYVTTEPTGTAAQVITFLTPATQAIASPLTLAASASSGLPVHYTLLSGPASLSGGVLTFTGTGNVTVRASQSGDATHLPAPNVERTFSVGLTRQIILFTPPATAKATATVTLDAIASSGLPIGYTLLSGPGSLDGSVLTFTGNGAVSIRASQAGNSQYEPATSIVRTITAARTAQTLTFTLPKSAMATETVVLNGVASSGLPVQHAVISGPASINGGLMTFSAEGTVVVRASQAGDSLFEPAIHLERSFKVSKASQTITFPGPASIANIDTLTLTPSATSGLPVTLSVYSGPAILTNGVLSFTGPGRVILRACQAGDARYYAAKDVLKTITAATVRPVLNPVSLPTVVVSQTIMQTITAIRNPISYTATGLPPGVILNSRTGQLTGKPTAAKMVEGKAIPYEVVFTAANSAGVSDPVTVLWAINSMPNELIGTFNGLIDRTEDFSLGGSVNIVTTGTGTFTGKLILETIAYAFSGKLDTAENSAPAATAIIKTVAGNRALMVSFTMDVKQGTLRGTVTDGATKSSATMLAWRNQWSALSRPATALEGTYNAALEMPKQLFGNPDYPQGNGFGTLRVSAAGIATWSGKLADGTAVTASTTAGPDGQIPLHIPLSTVGTVNGWLHLEGAKLSLLNGTLAWAKHPQATARSYKDGIPSHDLAVLGDKYLGTPISLPQGDGPAKTNDHVRLTFTEGGLDSAALTKASDGQLRQCFRLVSGRSVLMPAGLIDNPASVKLTLNTATGIISGTFVLKDADPSGLTPEITRVVSYTGLMVPCLNQGVGYFVLPQLPSLEPLTTINTSPQLSGQVLLEIDQ